MASPVPLLLVLQYSLVELSPVLLTLTLSPNFMRANWFRFDLMPFRPNNLELGIRMAVESLSCCAGASESLQWVCDAWALTALVAGLFDVSNALKNDNDVDCWCDAFESDGNLNWCDEFFGIGLLNATSGNVLLFSVLEWNDKQNKAYFLLINWNPWAMMPLYN